MWRVFSVLVVVCLVCLFSVAAQTVNEAESSIIPGEKTINISLAIESFQDDSNRKITLELLDEENKIRSQAAPNLAIKKGKNIYKMSLSLPDLPKTLDNNDLVWYRLRYRIGNSAGIISLSELLRDDFHLRVAASEVFRAGMNYRVRVRALQPYTEKPVSDVKIAATLKLDLETEADEDELNIVSKGKTDAEGFALLEFKIPENVKLDEDGDLEVVGVKNGITRELDEDLDSISMRDSVFLTADKPIYQPGQMFNIRGLLFDANQISVADSELKFKIYDEDGTVLYRETVKTSDFGIASVAWRIPDNAKLGSYRVEVEAENDLNESSLRFKVTRYDLPNFSVTAKPDKTFYLPIDKIAEIAVSADYLFGKPVTKGKVRVVQETERRWNYKEQKYDIEEKQSFEGELDAEGKFIAKADLSKAFESFSDSRWRRFEDLHFAAYFTDLTTNKTEQKRFDVRLTREPIHVYLVGQNRNENPNLPFTAYVSAFYADGTPAVCDVEIKGKYADAQKFEPLTRIKTNRLGAGKFSFFAQANKDLNENFELKITARDANRQAGTFEQTIDFDDAEAVKIETEKTIFKPGETVKISIVSTKKDALVYLDVVQNWNVLDSRFVRLKNGRGDLKIPYNPNFKGDLTIAVYTDESRDSYYYEGMKAGRGIIFPAQQNLKLAADFTSAVYKPNEEAKVSFSVLDGANKVIQSALGIVVFDKAVEERARTDAEFGSYFSRFYNLMGYQKSFGGITLKDLNDLDLSKPVSPEVQLAAEIMLAENDFSPRIYRTRENPTKAKSLYAKYFEQQFAPVELALKSQFAENYEHPTDDASLRKILSSRKINFDALRDPWNQPYRAAYSIVKENNLVTFETAGANKLFGDRDDFSVAVVAFQYFAPIGHKINRAVKDFHTRTGEFIRDEKTLRAELINQDINLDDLKDRWNRNYYTTFSVSGRNYFVMINSSGENGKREKIYYSTDDFPVWTSAIDYFAETEQKINEILSRTVNRDKKPFPQSAEEFKKLLKENNVDFNKILDGYGNPVDLTFTKQSRYVDKTKIENGKQTITPITQEIAIFNIRSKGTVAKYDYDDFNLASFSSVIAEQSRYTDFSKIAVKNIAISGANGALRGTVKDSQDAVVPNATVTLTGETTTLIRTLTTNEIGEFLINDIVPGKYSLKVDTLGFKTTVISGIEIRSQNLLEVAVNLEVGTVTEMVDVSGGSIVLETSTASVSINTQSSRIIELPLNGRNVLALAALQPGVAQKNSAAAKENPVTAIEENSTPRLREYFPETLAWMPELLTDKYGKAQMKFKLADNITTWKLYTIASTKNGKIGVAEKEIQAFQPFFVDLDPPKFLTVGDEIHLPTQVRNYTDKTQKVGVSMAKNEWFSFLNQANQTVNVAPGNSENAVFGFKTLAAVKDGKQRVTAIAAKDSDAIEKPVTVRPDGQEIVKTDSKLFSKAAVFDVNFPANSLPETAQAELKIYPNLMAHVTESVEGLLKRPYGCGEQTISSTYPNLMILKFTKENSKLRQTAQKYLQKGYERMLGYQVADGGFTYWGGKDSSDIALTAYAIRFLTDAQEFITVDEDVIKRAKDWLIKQQRTDGSFTRQYYNETAENAARTKLFTAYIARTLAKLKEKDSAPLQKALAYLKAKNAEIDEPYALALFALASFDAGNSEDAQKIVEKLEKMAISEADAVYWNLETNTPFYGWGTAGRVETSALVLQSLIKANAVNKDEKRAELISKATLFLLKNKDRYGVWYSTQTTINVLDSFLAALDSSKAENQTLQVLLNGAEFQTLPISADQIEPVILKLDGKINQANNRLEIKSSSNLPVMSQIVAAHYVDWKDADFSSQTANQSRALKLDYKCDKQNAKIMEEVSCAVNAERIGFQGYGMLLAEIGIPPGADVSRESLQEAMKNDWSLTRYDILPDRIILYMWSKAGGTNFNFKFKPRYGINAQTPSSIVYDYYNEEAKALVAPIRFNVK